MGPFPQYSTIIFDIGDVLFSWSSNTKTTISSKTLRKILSTPTWFDYERGLISQELCYDRIGSQFSIDPEEVGKAFDDARDSLQCNEEVVHLIRDLKSKSRDLRIFAMSNISSPDYQVLLTKPADWSIFDEVFTSAAAGERKPNLGFYRQVIAKANIDPSTAIFVDDKSENVLSARSLGFHGIVFDNPKTLARSLYNLVGDPVNRSWDYLRQHAGAHQSITDTGIVLQENFSQLLILGLTDDRSLVDMVEYPRNWNFFQGNPLLTTEEFPFDLDTTSLGLSVTKADETIVLSVMDEMLEYVNPDGIVQTYFDHQRPRIDPVVCVNVLTLFYMYGRGSELYLTVDWVYDVLLNRAYLDGTRYYSTGDCFLYFLGRLLSFSDSAELHERLQPLLKERVLERIGAEGDALALAMRILTCLSLGIVDTIDLRKLLPLQCEDGGWESSWLYKYGSSGIRIGNRGLTTVMAVKAIEGMRSHTVPSQPAHCDSISHGAQPCPEQLLKEKLLSAAVRTSHPACDSPPNNKADYNGFGVRRYVTSTHPLVLPLVSCLMLIVSGAVILFFPPRLLFQFPL